MIAAGNIEVTVLMYDVISISAVLHMRRGTMHEKL